MWPCPMRLGHRGTWLCSTPDTRINMLTHKNAIAISCCNKQTYIVCAALRVQCRSDDQAREHGLKVAVHTCTKGDAVELCVQLWQCLLAPCSRGWHSYAGMPRRLCIAFLARDAHVWYEGRLASNLPRCRYPATKAESLLCTVHEGASRTTLSTAGHPTTASRVFAQRRKMYILLTLMNTSITMAAGHLSRLHVKPWQMAQLTLGPINQRNGSRKVAGTKPTEQPRKLQPLVPPPELMLY